MLAKQPYNINFAQGVETKLDPFQLPAGKFLSLVNGVFDKGGRLTKRNGFTRLTALSDTTSTVLTTFNGGLTAIGANIQALSSSTNQWVSKGSITPISLNTLSLVRSATQQSQADSVVAPNGLVCTVFTDNIPSGGSTNAVYKYVIADLATGQNIIAPTTITDSGPLSGSPRVILFNQRFIIIYTANISSANHLRFIGVSISDPTKTIAPADLASNYAPNAALSFDAVVAGNNLYVAYNTTVSGQAINVTYLDQNLNVATPVAFATEIATNMSVCVDNTTPSNPTIWAAYYDSASQVGKALAVDSQLRTIKSPTSIISTPPAQVLNITSVATAGVLRFFYEITNNYSYDSSLPSHYILTNTLPVGGALGSSSVCARSLGLASKAFLVGRTSYILGAYQSAYQPTYFLINSSGTVVSKLAYQNGGGYLSVGLPNVTVSGTTAYVPYLIKDLLLATNKTPGASSAPVYTQTGVNLAEFNFVASNLYSAEIGSNLNITGGITTMYDGYELVEQGFFLYPDNVECTWSTTGGNIVAQPGGVNTNAYFYQVCYEWMDNQGNIFRSAPSLPVGVTTTGTGTTGSITVNIPTLRLTYKSANPVKVVVYRWSAGQQTYYRVTSVSIPTLNDKTVDSIAYVDTLADSSIVGNSIIYTNGGVIENVAPPATDVMTLFNNRLWVLDSEDRNLLWYSKQVIEGTPVEMSDLLTMYVAPTTSVQGSTGNITAIAPMDDKLIIFKKNALGYIAGVGPDNTGASNGYSDFALITSTVGCVNQKSVVITPNGLMFQSQKGIWIVARDLSTNYIGAPVEAYTTGANVVSAINVPNTNQIRFTMDSGVTLMFDYYYNQWGVFTNVLATSSCVYQSLHTYINSLGQVFQESPGLYLDNGSPVLMSFKTGWFNLAGLQGFERFYEMLLLGQYVSPFKLNMQIAYDYNDSPRQSTVVTPAQHATTWGSDAVWGASQAGGGYEDGNVFRARLFPSIQKCESFQISMQELSDRTQLNVNGGGLTLSGMNLLIGLKRGNRTSKASRSFG